ncbi:ribonuclease P protein component [Actinobaculum suis]|uniref:ribonuclease P protein component n=1 Tax=Actinobaculum suis TaxID=1657 RepID=UPI0009E31B66
MLSSDHRMRRSEDFAAAFSGVRGNSRRLQVAIGENHAADEITGPHPVRVGFAVSKKVGNSVVRHRLTRQLRHIVREKLGELYDGECVVVRAFPAANGSTYAQLTADFDRALHRARKQQTGQRTRRN